MDAVTDGTLCGMLRHEWGWGEVRLTPLTGGHTNRSFRVHGDAPPCVARLSWAGKTAAQVGREARMLTLARRGLDAIAVPTIIHTRHGADHARTAAGHWLHVFEHIEGSSGVPADTPTASAAAMDGLASLHAVLARADVDTGDPVAWLLARYRRVGARAVPLGSDDLARDCDEVLRRIGQCLARASTWPGQRVQWLHGDFHAGNLLFDRNRLRGVVDFDEVGQGSPWLEAAFAAFALSRDVGRDDAFRFDTSLWQAAMARYAQDRSQREAAGWIARRNDLAALFCADQVLIHLQAAQRGLWTPGVGMGFLGCWRALLAQPPTGDNHRRTASTVASLAWARGEPSCRQGTASSPASD